MLPLQLCVRIVSLIVRNKNEIELHIVVGFDNLNKYLTTDKKHNDAVIYRHVNRIKNGKSSMAIKNIN